MAYAWKWTDPQTKEVLAEGTGPGTRDDGVLEALTHKGDMRQLCPYASLNVEEVPSDPVATGDDYAMHKGATVPEPASPDSASPDDGIQDGIYFRFPDGCAWECFLVRGGSIVDHYPEAEHGTRLAAGEERYEPNSEIDRELDADESELLDEFFGVENGGCGWGYRPFGAEKGESHAQAAMINDDLDEDDDDWDDEDETL